MFMLVAPEMGLLYSNRFILQQEKAMTLACGCDSKWVEKKEALMKNKVYKFSHFVIYSRDERQTSEALDVEHRGIAVDQATARAPGIDGAFQKHPGNHQQYGRAIERCR